MSVFSAFVISLINSGPVFEGYREEKKPLAMGISAFNCHEIHRQYTWSQAWWCNPVIPTLREAEAGENAQALPELHSETMFQNTQ